jgi:hypothetical protein
LHVGWENFMGWAVGWSRPGKTGPVTQQGTVKTKDPSLLKALSAEVTCKHQLKLPAILKSP